MEENERYMSPVFMENAPLPDSARACSNQRNSVKKRARLEMSSAAPIREHNVRESSAKHSEVLLLREALKSERETLRKLQVELDKERGASMTAANEAMAMITRLQEEKAAVLMEARRYRRVAEEREGYNQEAISVLKDALLTKEDDLLALQDLFNAYRESLLRLKDEQSADHASYLEEGMDQEQVLYLEGPNATHSTYPVDNQFIRTGASIQRTLDGGHEQFECHKEFEGMEPYHAGHADSCRNFIDRCLSREGLPDEEGFSGPSRKGDFRGKEQPEMLEGFGLETTFCESQLFQSHIPINDQYTESGYDKLSQEHSLDSVSESIFARIQRLEERFEFLRQNQTMDYQRLNGGRQADLVILDDMEADRKSVPKGFSNAEVEHCSKAQRLPACGDSREWEEALNCLPFESVRKDLRRADQKECPLSPREVADLRSERTDGRSNLHNVDKTSYVEMNDDSSEGVHDIYEVQYETKRPFVCPPEQDRSIDKNKQNKCETDNMDTMIPGMVQEADTEGRVRPVPGNYVESMVSTALDDELSLKIDLLDIKGVHANVADDDDVQQLKVRLQALEGERASMKEAIESLRKENKDLKVLQEIAQQLRELKSGVRGSAAPKLQDQLSICSFFKGILALAGFQNLVVSEGSRCLRSRFSFNKHEQGGLLHIISNTHNSVCITRERKVNFNTA